MDSTHSLSKSTHSPKTAVVVDAPVNPPRTPCIQCHSQKHSQSKGCGDGVGGDLTEEFYWLKDPSLSYPFIENADTSVPTMCATHSWPRPHALSWTVVIAPDSPATQLDERQQSER